MNTNTKSVLTNEETEAVQAAIKSHGRSRAKSAIYRAWFDGNYQDQCLDAHSRTLQNLRNREGGREALGRTVLRHLVDAK